MRISRCESTGRRLAMAKQDYILKKFVRAENAAEAAAMDKETAVAEVFLAAEKPIVVADRIGFRTVEADLTYECGARQPKKK